MSLSASAENLSAEHQGYDGSTNMCLELALEGERLCKAGDCRAGVAFFQAAIQAGTDDLRTLSAIYSQLGNAYFYLGDYGKAMQYHKHDLTLARTMGDKLGEAKSSGNLGNTLKVMGRFDEAVVCCKRHLELSRELGDRLSEGRALYNLGNVYHAKGKHVGRVGQKDPGEFSEDVKSCLQQAVRYYEENLSLMRELGDLAAQGRACGNLGNTFYLLGDFAQAIFYHEERLAIAKQFGDKAAERRAHSNLGNSHIFMGQFEEAAHHYKCTLALAQELGDHAVEAQACYSLGNTYTLLRNYELAVDYHLRHLLIAQNLSDRIGEARACWSLGNANASLGNHEKALYFARKHLEISKELSDPMGEATAKMNIADLKKILNLPDSPDSVNDSNPPTSKSLSPQEIQFNDISHQRIERVRRQSMEQLSLIKLTPDGKQRPGLSLPKKAPSPTKGDDADSFFDLLSKYQSKRMDDQRCSLTVDNKENTNVVNIPKKEVPKKESPDDLIDLIAGLQSRRMDEQRVALPHLPGLQGNSLQKIAEARSKKKTAPDDKFFDQLVRCQSTRLDDQRSVLPSAASIDAECESPPSHQPKKSGSTVPDEDFFSLIMKVQSGRMDDQRATVPAFSHRMTNGNLPQSSNGLKGNGSAEQAVTKSQEYRLLEELLQGDLYGNVSTQNTLDNWSISDYDSEEFENPPPPPPLRFDSLPEEETKSTPTTPQLKRHSRTQWFTDHQPSTASTAKSSSSDKKGWFQQVKNVVLASSELVKGGVRHRDSMVDRPRTGNGKYSNKKGMLYKVQKGPVEELFGEYSGRWCVLENLSLQCYADNTCETMKEQFPTDSILSIQILQDTKIKHDNADLHCFQLNTSGKIRGRHVYGSRNMAERRDWMQKLAECLTKSFSSKFTSDYLRMGWAYVREAVTGNWAGAWIILSNRILQYAIDDQPLKTIDLRRARFIDLQNPQESDNNPRTSDEKGPNMFVDWTSGVLYLRMWTARETKAWCYVVKKAAHNNGPNLEDQQLTKNDIPVIVEKCINFIYLHGSMSKGIYRQSGVGSSISDLITKFREDAWAMQITQDKYTEHDVATALKRFFRDLPEPLLGPAHHQYLYQVSLVKNVEDRIRMYKAALDNLSPIAYKTTRKLIGHLHFISTQSGKNLMTVQNLAALWGPTLMHYENKDGPQQSGGHKQHILIVSQLINLYRNIFPEDRDEIEKEQLMLQILEKHTQSPQGAINKTAGDFRVWIYFNNKEGKTFNIAIGPNKTALDILVELSPKVNIDVHELTLEEVVLDDKLFRPIHYQEKVLDIVLRWSYWDEADRKENYIAISQLAKYAEYQETKPATFAEEIKYADSKSRTFKPLVFEFSQAKLTCFKDKLCTVPLSSWKVEEIFWYFGHEAKRNPQRKWTVTFFDKDVHPKRTKTSPYFGHILAWDDPQSRMNWLGAMLRAQYPNGLQPPVIHINLIT